MNPAGSRTAGRTSSSRPSRFGFEGPFPAPRPLRPPRNPGDVPHGRRLRFVDGHRGSASPDGRHPEADPDPRETLLEQGRGREAQPERRHADVAAAEVERRHGRQAGRADDQDGAARGQARGHQSPALAALAADRRDTGRPDASAERRGGHDALRAARTPGAAAPGRSPGATGPSPAELYDTAYADYTKGRYALAIQGFQDYLSSYPSTDLSDNAQYWIGESHFAQKKYTEAIADFTDLLKRWPASDKAAAALLKKGYALVETGQKAEAVVQLQYVIHEFPSSDEARLAKARLKSMGIDTRG